MSNAYTPPAYAPPAPGPDRSERTEPLAVLALILALASLIIPVFTAVMALALALGGRRNIKASNGLRRGNGLVIAAVVISLLTLLTNLAVALWFFSLNTN